jgi:hypothetical protein
VTLDIVKNLVAGLESFRSIRTVEKNSCIQIIKAEECDAREVS